MKNTIQNRDGLPDALAEDRRFFELYGSGKTDTPKGWNIPQNWKELEEIPEDKYFGFAIGNGTDYLFIDADHVRNPETGSVVSWFYDVWNRLIKAGTTYTELSKSGTGYHMICDLGDFADNFAAESNGYNQIIVAMDPSEYDKLSTAERDATPKVEFFYHTDGRYIYLTGQHKKKHEVARNEVSANIFHELLKIRDEFHAQYAKSSTIEKGSKIEIDEVTRKRVLEALPYISASARETWVKVGQSLYNCGFPFDLWDEWSQFADQRTGEACDKYDPKETPKIWKSFINSKSHWNAGTIIKLAKENGYSVQKKSLLSGEFSDVAQAALFAREYGSKVRYSKATGFLVYSGKVWETSDLKAQRLSQELTERQLREAREKLWSAREREDNAIEGTETSIDDMSDRASVKAALQEAKSLRNSVVSRRTSQKINATLKEAAPLLEVDVKQLDRDGFLLNTPAGTVDLRTGKIREHDPEDYCTKITTVSPDNKNSEMFEEFLDQITCNDPDLKRYLQEVSGEFAVGEVKREEAFIVTGAGGNGKSTFFNLQFKVLGDYAGLISSEVLITNSRKNKSPELAELRGKRMILAAELEEGQRLDTAMIKKIASTDPIRAEQKYRDPFDFIPSHSIILYTNFLPKVGARDSGTWDRLRVIPFNARFRNTENEVKDYASVLFDQCGGAVLTWIIEGARKYIENGFRIEQPECVKQAIEEYREENDWLRTFLSERCLVSFQYSESGGVLYREYRSFCESMGEFPRSNAELRRALEGVGITYKKTNSGAVYRGLRLKSFTETEAAKAAAIMEA